VAAKVRSYWLRVHEELSYDDDNQKRINEYYQQRSEQV
jgi:hypothetical protein